MKRCPAGMEERNNRCYPKKGLFGYEYKRPKDSNIFHQKELHSRWGDGKTIKYGGREYAVGKMSYGDYFLEPVMTEAEKRLYYGETKPMHPDRLWLEKVDYSDYYVV